MTETTSKPTQLNPMGIFTSSRARTHKIMSLLEETDIAKNASAIDIYLAPPQNSGNITDEDSADEDEGGTINNLNFRQLDAEAELVICNSNEEVRIGEENIQLYENTLSNSQENENSPSCEADEQNIHNEMPSSSKKKRNTKSYKVQSNKKTIAKGKTAITRKWIQGDLPENNNFRRLREEQNKMKLVKPLYLSRPMTPLDFFYLFFDDELLTLIVKETVRYAMQQGTALELGVDELKLFIGVLLLSGYESKPRRDLYWEESDDVKNILVSKSIRRNRFKTIMRFLHFNDNDNINPNDRMYKLSPLVTKLKHSFCIHNIWECETSIDEAMIPYYGRHGMKQHIQGKPIRFGYKTWCWNNKLGYLIDFEIYQGAKGPSNEYKNEYGLGGSVVLKFCENLPREKNGQIIPRIIYTDNYFTSLRLVDKLTSMGVGITGTIRSNRVEKCPLPNLAKSKRGTYDSQYDENNGLILCRWNDNSVVTVVSNHEGVQPLVNAKRYSFSEHKRISVPQPYMIKRYNENMGGTDRMDQNVAAYRTRLRSKKWYWPLFAWLLDVSVQNGWLLYRQMREDVPDQQKMDLLAFRRYLAKSLLCSYGIARKRTGPTSATNLRTTCDIRFDNVGHLIVSQEKRTRCNRCHSTTFKKCSKCGVALHEKCFYDYHTPPK